MRSAGRGARVALFATLAAAAALLASTAGAQEPAQTRMVEGRLVNGTEGGPVPAGATVVLHEESATRHEHREAVTDAGGAFRFDGIAVLPDTVYGVSVTYGGAVYGVDLDLSVQPEPVTLTVYEPMRDDSILKVPTASVLFAQVDSATQTLWALEIVSVVNDTDRTYVPGPEPMQILRFGLPAGAEGLTVDTRLLQPSVIQVDRGFGLFASVPPGEHEVMYAYRFPYSGSETEFSRPFRYGAERLRVLAPRDVAALSAGSLGVSENVAIGEQDYNVLTLADVGRNDRVSVTLRDLPTRSFGDAARGRVEDLPWELAAPAFLALLLGAVVVVAVRRRGSRTPTEAVAESASASHGEYERLLLALVSLERRFEDGDIDDADYDRSRAALAARLAEVSRRRNTGP